MLGAYVFITCAAIHIELTLESICSKNWSRAGYNICIALLDIFCAYWCYRKYGNEKED